jgi:phosphoribosylformylglycinamidine synthase
MRRPDELDDLQADDPTYAPFDGSVGDAFFSVLGSPNVASKRWVYEQYDHLVQGNTVAGPGSNAAVVRLEGSLRAMLLSTDGKGRYGFLDPYLGAAHSVAEAARNVAVTGGVPVAITNCLNFGNPEVPEVMWSFAQAIWGMSDACRAFETPVTGGNVSFYNESGDSRIYPTPVVGMLGLIDDYRLVLRPGFPSAGLWIYLLGDTMPELGGSEFAEVVLGKVSGRPPEVNFERESRLHRVLHELAMEDVLASAHDCSDGGLAVTLAECAIAGEQGFAVNVPGDLPSHVALFSESASRAVVSVRPDRAAALEQLCTRDGVAFARIGETGGPRIVLGDAIETTVEEVRRVYEDAIPRLLEASS